MTASLHPRILVSEQPPMMKKVLFQMYYFKEIVRLKMFAHFAIINLVD